MKIALIYVGHIRSWDAVKQNHLENILDQSHEVDVFVETYREQYRFDYHVRRECDEKNIYSDDSLIKLFEGMNLVSLVAENQISGMSADDGQRRKIIKAFNLFENSVSNISEYDLVIKCRLDLFFDCKLEYDSILEECLKNKIILGSNVTPHINDTFAVSTPELMKKYFNRFSLTGDYAIYNSINSLKSKENCILEEKIKHKIVRLSENKNSQQKFVMCCSDGEFTL